MADENFKNLKIRQTMARAYKRYRIEYLVHIHITITVFCHIATDGETKAKSLSMTIYRLG